MSALNPSRIVDTIEWYINELRPIYGFGEVKNSRKPPGLVVPKIATSVHPTLFAAIQDQQVFICVEWIVAVHKLRELDTRLEQEMRDTARFHRSRAGWDKDTGNIFVYDSFPAPATKSDFRDFPERFLSLLEHVREIRKGFPRYAPIQNGFC